MQNLYSLHLGHKLLEIYKIVMLEKDDILQILIKILKNFFFKVIKNFITLPIKKIKYIYYLKFSNYWITNRMRFIAIHKSNKIICVN